MRALRLRLCCKVRRGVRRIEDVKDDDDVGIGGKIIVALKAERRRCALQAVAILLHLRRGP